MVLLRGVSFFISDLPNTVNNLCQMYADDTKVFAKVGKRSVAKLLWFNADKTV